MSADLMPAGLGGRLILAAADYRRNKRAWLRARRSGLGASETAAVLGLSPWKTALDVYLDKTGPEPVADVETSEATAWGNLLEPVVARRTVRVHPELGKLVPTPGLLAHPEHSWMLATIDFGLADRGSRSAPVRELLEVKTTSVHNYRANWIDGVPPAMIQVQCQQQMAVTGLDVAWVTCFVGGDSGPGRLAKPYPVQRSEAVIEQLITYGGAWWSEFVLAGKRPEPTFADRSKLAALYPADDSLDSVPVTDELETALADLLDARRRIKEEEEREAAAVFKLKTAMGSRTAIAGPDGDVLVTWKEQTSRRLDQKALAADHPELVKQYKRPPAEPTRFLRIKYKEEQ